MRAIRKLQVYLHESNLIAGYDDPEFDKALLKAWEYLGDTTRPRGAIVVGSRLPITNDVIQKMHEHVISRQKDQIALWPGVYRDRSHTRIMLPDGEAVSPTQVAAAMDNWVERFNKNEESPQALHVSFERIHPFIDGNGRVGRMLLWYQQQLLGMQPTLITEADVKSYFSWFKENKDD